MKRNVTLKTAVAIIFAAILSVVSMFGQSVSLTGYETLANIFAESNQIPLELYPPGTFEQLEAIGDNLIPIVNTNPQRPVRPSSVASMGGGGIMMGLTRPGGGTPASPSYYTITDLGTLGGSYCAALGINASGQIVGSSYTSGSVQHAFLYSNNQITDLGTPANTVSVATAINNAGKIVGYMDVSGGSHAFTYTSSMVDINTTLGGAQSFAGGIDTAGGIVGWKWGANNSIQHAFSYSGGSPLDLGTLGGNYSVAFGKDDYNDIVGYAYLANGNYHAFVDSGSMQDLGTLGGNTSVAYGIDQYGEAVGQADTSTAGVSYGFIYTENTMQPLTLGANSSALAVNPSGSEVVGTAVVGSANHAFVYYYGGQTVDLNNYLIPASSWTLSAATGVNDQGQIACYGYIGSTIHSFLLTPYPTLNYKIFYQEDGGVSGKGVPSTFGYDSISTANYGCALCSLASMLTTLPGLESITPAQLDIDLTRPQNGTVQEGYKSNDSMNWQEVGQDVKYSITTVDSSDTITSQSVLEQYLENHCWGNRYRVILHFTMTSTDQTTRVQKSGDHFVLVVGRNNINDWILFDPGWKHAYVNGQEDSLVLSSLNGHYAGFTTVSSTTGHQISQQFSIKGVRTFAVSPSSTAFAGNVALCPVEMLVTDPNGKRVGHDPVTGTDVFEIPGASYIRDFAIADVNGNSNPVGETDGIKTVCIPSPLGGTYTTVLTGTATGSYTLNSSIYWSSNSQSSQITSGTTGLGLTSTNTLFVITPPIITSSSVSGNMFNLSFTAQTNVTYVLEGKNSLTGTSWTSLQTVTATGTNMAVHQQMTSPIMFYQVKSQ